MPLNEGTSYLVALDAGGTMTDTFLTDLEGNFCLGKALTRRGAEYQSYLTSVADAAEATGSSLGDIHRRATESIYTGTTMLNTLLTRTGSKMGLILTKGFGADWWNARAMTWLGRSYEDQMHLATHRHPHPLTEPSWVKYVHGRIAGPSWFLGCHVPPGTEIVPLQEDGVERAVNDLLDEGVQVIGICLINSYANPSHERRAAEIARRVIDQRGVAVSVVSSYEICPRSFHVERLHTLMLHCYTSLPMQAELRRIEQVAKENDFRYALETFLSYGATVAIDYPRLHEAISSGPTGGLIGAQALLSKTAGIENIVCCDLGGTSFDVGVILHGQLPIEPEPDFDGRRLRMPMLKVDSVGQGTGSYIHVDHELRKIKVGPDSAGSNYGTALDAPAITIGDVDVALGYIDPDYFLGGKVKLDRERAIRELSRQLAEPLGMDVFRAGLRVYDLLHSNLCDHLLACVQSVGHRPEDYTLICYGGSGPLHLWGLETTPHFGRMCTVPWAAAFSAFGIAMSDRFTRFDKTVDCVLPAQTPLAQQLTLAHVLSEEWQELEGRAVAELARMGYRAENVEFRYKASGRYLGQMHSWEFDVDSGRIETAGDLEALIGAFERTYTGIYPQAARFPQSGYVITEICCEAYLPRIKPRLHAAAELSEGAPAKSACRGRRKAYCQDHWIDFDLWDMDQILPGNRVAGPAIIEHPMTTLVVPPDRLVQMDKHRIIWYGRE